MGLGPFQKAGISQKDVLCSELNRKVNQMSCCSLLALKHSIPMV